MKLQIKRLTETAIIPQYQHSTDSGMDLHFDRSVVLYECEYIDNSESVTAKSSFTNIDTFTLIPGERALLSTGITIQLPPNTEAQVRSRSGLALNRGIQVLNSPGTIDEGYQGEIKVILYNAGYENFTFNYGDRIAQLVIMPVLRPTVEEVKEFSEVTDRGIGGFGSTGVENKVGQTEDNNYTFNSKTNLAYLDDPIAKQNGINSRFVTVTYGLGDK